MPRRRKYSAEFKREAVALANQPGVTKAQIGRELDINPNMITRWQREMTANRSKKRRDQEERERKAIRDAEQMSTNITE
jgi:transposase-like protein